MSDGSRGSGVSTNSKTVPRLRPNAGVGGASAARARERALYRCSVWDRDGPLEVHHRTYERRGVERDEDVIALCATCHRLYHEWRL